MRSLDAALVFEGKHTFGVEANVVEGETFGEVVECGEKLGLCEVLDLLEEGLVVLFFEGEEFGLSKHKESRLFASVGGDLGVIDEHLAVPAGGGE